MSNKLVKGAAIIGISSLIVKVLGAFFRIPLTNWIGGIGMSYYGFAYTIYGALLVLSTAGLPIAISRLVSESIAKKEYKNAHKIFRVSLTMLFIIGLVSASICFFGGGFLAKLFGNPDAKMAVMAIAPALLFVPIVSAFRGYFQGRQNMNPTAISEIVEQFVRVIVGLSLAYAFLAAGEKKAAAGAAFGASAGSIASLIVIFLIFLMNKRVINKKIDLNSPNVEETSAIVKKLVVIAVPIIIGSELMPIMNLIDMSIIMTRLQATGWTYKAAKNMYGIISGFCNPIIAFPQLFTQAVAISLVPAISKAAAINDTKNVRENVALGYRTTMIMAFPCAVGLFVLAKPILLLFYMNQQESAVMAVPTMMILAVSVISLAISQTSTGVLQAIGKQNLPVIHLFFGCLVKVVITFILVGIPAINIRGAAIGTMVAETIAFVLNNRSVYKYTGTKINYMITYFKPLGAAAAMGVCVFLAHKGLSAVMGNSLATLISIVIGGIVYGVLIFALKAITIEEVETFPGGHKIAKVLRKFVK